GSTDPLQGIYVPIMPQYSAEFQSAYPYDVEKGKALMAEAGLADGVQGVKIFGWTDMGDPLQGIQADLAAIGIEAEVTLGTWADYRDQIRAGDIPLAVYSWSASFPDAYDYVSGWMTCAAVENGFNDGGYCNERIDELVAGAEALPLTDPERIAAYREIEELAINTDVAMIGLGNEKAVGLGKENVHDDPLNGLMGGWPFLDAAWIE
ncbi:MAG: ABC transporter substrate-binding protein, partial [Thermomicrobiales bacterium]